MSEPAYCTILATNYLPKALALAESLSRFHPEAELTVMLIDAATDDQLPDLSDLPNVRCVSTSFLGLPQAEVFHLATIYDLVEFATAIKPVMFKRLLEGAEQVAYLDPDTFVTAPMIELPLELAASEGGILLTPHFLEPLPDDAPVAQGHLLTVGVYNLGFGAFDRRAAGFLDWWWDRLREECLFDPLSGLFVDQKWVDIGSVLFHAGSMRHYGYNVSVVNLHERPLGRDEDGYVILANGDRLRLFHFHAFDTAAPGELSTRLSTSTAHLRTESGAVDALCNEYAELLVKQQQRLPPAPAYPYFTDTAGKHISRQLRRAYRLESQHGDASLPSPFVASQAEAWAAWRRRAWKPVARELLSDAVKSIRLALPEEYARVKDRFPRLIGRARSATVGRSGGIWG